MTPARKIIGFIIAALIGIPVLFATIIAVGVSNAVVTPEVMSDMPREIIAELPDTIDELYTELQPSDIDDEWTRNMVTAMKKTGISPVKVMTDSGMFTWMQDELSESIRQLGEVLRGERSPRPIILDMTPLRNAFLHPAVTSWMASVIRNLPECDDMEIEEWKRIALSHDWHDRFHRDDFPACRPAGLDITDDLVREIQSRAAEEIPSEEEILDDWEDIPRGWNITKMVSAVTYTLFIFPALLIFLGSLTAATSRASFFRWSGVTTLIGGLLAYGLSSLLQNLIPATEFGFRYDLAHSFSSRFEELVLTKAAGLSEIFLNSLFGPASKLGGTVAVIGLILFALSFLIQDEKKNV